MVVRWSFSGVWVTASLLRSPGLFWVFLPDLNNAAVLVVSIFLLISKSSSPLSKPLGALPSVLNTIGITVTLLLHTFLVLWQGWSICLSFCLYPRPHVRKVVIICISLSQEFFLYTSWKTYIIIAIHIEKKKLTLETVGGAGYRIGITKKIILSNPHLLWINKQVTQTMVTKSMSQKR